MLNQFIKKQNARLGRLMGFVERAIDCLGDTELNRVNLDLLESGIDSLIPFVGAGLSIYTPWLPWMGAFSGRNW